MNDAGPVDESGPGAISFHPEEPADSRRRDRLPSLVREELQETLYFLLAASNRLDLPGVIKEIGLYHLPAELCKQIGAGK